jgi:hypothetical protein
MRPSPLVAALTVSLGLHAVAGAQENPPAPPVPTSAAAAEGPLFASHDVLPFRLQANLDAVFKERGQKSTWHPATLSYTDSTGAAVRLPIRIKTRGNFRLRRSTCEFPPLYLDFPTKEVKHTLFAGQKKLKLTVHCQDKKDRYEQQLLLEYLIYRVFNQLTDNSFDVRLARFTYVDSAGKRDSLTRYAFFLEDNDRLAGRLGGRVFNRLHVVDQATDSTQIGLVWMLEYLVGNTDYSVWALHNIVLVLQPSSSWPLAVPYDFDWSGVVDAPYAHPDSRLPIRSVRERLYRGFCRPPDALTPVIQLFNDKKDAIYDLYRNQEGLDPKMRDEALKYYDEFYKTINDPKAVQHTFLENCRKLGLGPRHVPAPERVG